MRLTGSGFGPARSQRPLCGRLESLQRSDDQTTRVKLLDADLDFQVTLIEPNRWREIKQRYEEIAKAHAAGCKYKDANHWLRDHRSGKTATP